MGVICGQLIRYEVVLERVPSWPLSPYFFHQSIIPTLPEFFTVFVERKRACNSQTLKSLLLQKIEGGNRKKIKAYGPFCWTPQPTTSSIVTMTTNYIITCHYYNEYWLTAMVINCKCLLMATPVSMSVTDTFDLHAVRHHQPSGCGRESSGLSEYHQRKHFEGHSSRSCHLSPSFFLMLQPWPGLGVVINMQA